MVRITQSELLKEAKSEERNYNWEKAAELYEKIAKSLVDRNEADKATEIYLKSAIDYYRAADKSKTKEVYAELLKKANKISKENVSICKQIGKKGLEFESEGLALESIAVIIDPAKNAKALSSKAYDFFKQANEIYLKENDQESYLRSSWWILHSVNFSTLLSNEQKEINKMFERGKDTAIKARNSSIKSRSLEYLAEILFMEVILYYNSFYYKDVKQDNQFKEYGRELIFKCEESLNIVKEISNSHILGLIYYSVGATNCDFGIHSTDDKLEQKKYIDRGLKYVEKAINCFRKTGNNAQIIPCLFILTFFSAATRRIEYLQKRIINDLSEAKKLWKIFSESNLPWLFDANYLATYYYSTMSQWKLFPPTQRKSYAKNGIKYAHKLLKKLLFGPQLTTTYLFITMSFSALSFLVNDIDEREKALENMVKYAKRALEIGENYIGGLSRSAGYNAMYMAYKTQAEISGNKEEKVSLLINAADMGKKFIRHTIESQGGNLAAQMRLGLIYEEIGTLTSNKDSLIEAKTLFNNIIKECYEKGYYSYAAASCEYAARIEDRIGHHTDSAICYEKARDSYSNSMNKVEYKPLKRRIIEKKNYTEAWRLIENAKAYHKKENHLMAKESYVKAVEMLKDLSKYYYESNYYSAWVIQEEAEQLSKLEKHVEAAEKYRITKLAFNNSIKTMNDAFKRFKDEFTRQRIIKLEKVAQLRIKYCSARADVEKARILSKQGEYCSSAELFASAALEFRDVCNLFKNEQERRDLEAVYYLCRAWESMELAEKYIDPERFREAANLFFKASRLFNDSKLKLLASGNSAFCQALELGCKFDEVDDYNIKAEIYPKIRTILRKAASAYEKGGFDKGSDWVLATSTYFDAGWSLLQADNKLEFEERKKLLGIGSEYLKSAAVLFRNAGYEKKEREVLKRLRGVEKEETIIFSATNSITKPSISGNTTGIIAPSCPIETSQSPRLGEITLFTQEEQRVIEERVRKKYQLLYKDLLQDHSETQKSEYKIAIAQIGSSSSNDIINDFFEIKGSDLLGIKESRIDEINASIIRMAKEAHNNGANVLVFPEMMIDLNYNQIYEQLHNLAKWYQMYIIPGSYHKESSKKNVCIVIGPEGVLWEQEKHIPAIIHINNNKIKEKINVSSYPRKTFVCNTKYGRIAIAICRDFLDMDLRVELKNFEPPIDIVINPAFTPITADFKAAHFDARRSIYAYCFFANVAEFGDSLIYTPEKDRTERTIPAKEEGLIYKEIDLFKLRSERKKWEKEQKKELQFIQSTR